MNIAKLSKSDNIQTVILPQEFQIEGNEVYIKKMGNALILIPKDKPWQILWDSLELFSEDFMNSRDQPQQQQRETLFE